MRIGLVGHSHMGIVSSVGWASLGYDVVSVDTDKKLADELSQGIFPISEPQLSELFAEHKTKITYSTDFSLLKDCSLVLLVRDTPTKDDNTGDIKVISDLIDRAMPNLMKGAIFVSLSQAPVGF